MDLEGLRINMNLDLDGRVALVTGGARGIGKSIAFALARHHTHVALVDVDEDSGHRSAGELRDLGVQSTFQRCDVTRADEVKNVIDACRSELGGLDILVNNAGITRDGLLLRAKEDDWQRVLDVNLTGAFHFTQASARYLMKVDRGRVINIASVVGIMGNAGQSNYAASKGGLIAFTKAVARELAPRGVTVNAVAPGFIETEMTAGLDEKARQAMLQTIPAGRYGSPDDVANGVLFLASDLASYITGHVLVVSGGMAM
jgi:3-oxoacyl-[acyl-carrier protein] reductase